MHPIGYNTPMPVDADSLWTDLVAAADVPAGSARTIVVGDRAYAVCNDAGRFAVIDNACPHAGGSLGRGFVRDGKVFCPWHFFGWDLATGETDAPYPGRLRVYPCRLRAGRVSARLHDAGERTDPDGRDLLAK